MWVTDSGIVRLVKELQFWNAPIWIQVTDSGIVRLIKELQFPKAIAPISVTEFVATTRSKLRHCWKAPYPMRAVPSGIRTSNKSSLRHPDVAKLSHSSVGFMTNSAWGLKLRQIESQNLLPSGNQTWKWTITQKPNFWKEADDNSSINGWYVSLHSYKMGSGSRRHCELSRLPASTQAPSGMQTEMLDSRQISFLGRFQAIYDQNHAKPLQ